MRDPNEIQLDDILVARVMDEDKDYIRVEIAKRNDIPWRLNQSIDPDAAPDQFYFVLFVTRQGCPEGEMRTWRPWGDGDA